MSTTRGFTLVELLLATALSAFVATSAMVALNLVAVADTLALQRTEQGTAVTRALHLLRRDAALATAVSVQSGQCTFTARDGSAIAWVVSADGSELHRVPSANSLDLLAMVQSLLVAAPAAPEYSARGHLLDRCWRDTALVQGAVGITTAPVRSPRDGAVVGVRIAIDHAGPGGPTTAAALGLSLPLAERHGKP